jgi:hypothetical protein
MYLFPESTSERLYWNKYVWKLHTNQIFGFKKIKEYTCKILLRNGQLWIIWNYWWCLYTCDRLNALTKEQVNNLLLFTIRSWYTVHYTVQKVIRCFQIFLSVKVVEIAKAQTSRICLFKQFKIIVDMFVPCTIYFIFSKNAEFFDKFWRCRTENLKPLWKNLIRAFSILY